jgi:hypothetical protein
MSPAKIAASALILGWLLIASAFLTGCETLGISFETDYGRFSYTLPEIPALKDK